MQFDEEAVVLEICCRQGLLVTGKPIYFVSVVRDCRQLLNFLLYFVELLF